MASKVRWKGSWYFRKRSKTWRNKHTGDIASNPKGRRVGWEVTNRHTYGYFPVGRKIRKRTN